jgi:LPPG:FO 2-phospho-L-lactate transferase
MSDQPVRTIVDTDRDAAFRYFVERRRASRPPDPVEAPKSPGHPSAAAAIADPATAVIIICPSNPYLSIDPIHGSGRRHVADVGQ